MNDVKQGSSLSPKIVPIEKILLTVQRSIWALACADYIVIKHLYIEENAESIQNRLPGTTEGVFITAHRNRVDSPFAIKLVKSFEFLERGDVVHGIRRSLKFEMVSIKEGKKKEMSIEIPETILFSSIENIDSIRKYLVEKYIIKNNADPIIDADLDNFSEEAKVQGFHRR